MILLDVLVGGVCAFLLARILNQGRGSILSVIIGIGGGLFAFALYPETNFNFFEPLGESIASAIGAIILLIVAQRLRK